ncbi:MAG: thioredoxin family protein [Devosiaceae bacterium]|nr:thioredoxin family protein [Devosiaceae bacterium]
MIRIFTFLALVLLWAPAFAAPLGDDGLHKAVWMQDTFKDLREDLEEASASGKRLMVIVEQRGCIYCTKMHEEIFPLPEIDAYIKENYFVVQVNMFGDIEMTDFDGTALSEKQMMRRWSVMFTPTMIFYPKEVPEGASGQGAAVAVMPGAFDRWTTLNMLTWVVEEGYNGDEVFQKYHARILTERGIIE